MPQDQRSTYDQLRTLVGIANKNGLYDAADWLAAELDRWAASWGKQGANTSKRGFSPTYTETGVLPEGTTEQSKKHFYKERPVEQGRAKQCMDCGYIGVPNRQGGCAKCQSAAVTDKIYVGKEGSVAKTAYVSHVPGHKNSEGESAPWVVKQHNTGKILTSYKSEAEAKEGLRQMEIHKGGLETPSRGMLAAQWEQDFGDHEECPVCGTQCRDLFIGDEPKTAKEPEETSIPLTAKFLQKK